MRRALHSVKGMLNWYKYVSYVYSNYVVLDTEYLGTQDTKIECYFNRLSDQRTQYLYQGNSSSSWTNNITAYLSTWQWNRRFDGTYKWITVTEWWHKSIQDRTWVKLDSTTYAYWTVGDFVGTETVKIFSNSVYVAWIRSLKIYDNNGLVRDYVAVVRLEDNQPGFMDMTNHSFLTSSSSWLVAWPDL